MNSIAARGRPIRGPAGGLGVQGAPAAPLRQKTQDFHKASTGDG